MELDKKLSGDSARKWPSVSTVHLREKLARVSSFVLTCNPLSIDAIGIIVDEIPRFIYREIHEENNFI